jgi:hypothetical protein
MVFHVSYYRIFVGRRCCYGRCHLLGTPGIFKALACLPFFLLADATAGVAAGGAFLLPLLDRDDMVSCLLPDGVFFC